MSNNTFPFRSALVTGASSGIGRALCVALCEAGVDRLVLVARREDRLIDLANSLPCTTTVIAVDLTNEEEISQVLGEIDHIDMLINNAGFGSFGPFHEQDLQQQINMVGLNCTVPIMLAHHALERMVETNHGCVVNIASGMGFQSMPFMSTYAATKAFLLHWAEGVATELSGTGVRFITICPGTIDTGFAGAAGVPVHDIIGSSLVTGPIEQVVRDTLKAVRQNKTIVIPGWRHRLVLRLTGLVPRWLSRTLSAWAMARSHHRKING